MSDAPIMAEEQDNPWVTRIRREKAWLSSLKPGDEVALYDGWNYRLHKVDRLTQTQIIIDHLKFRRDTGRRIGGGTWDRTSLNEPSSDIREEIERKELLRDIGTIKWSLVTTDTLRAIIGLVKP